jgi:hypothetical protein
MDGTQLRVLDLKTRQFFRLMRIITRGAGGFFMQAKLDMSDGVDVFVAKLIGLLLIAVPESEAETIDFLMSMVEPASYVRGTSLSKTVQLSNDAAVQSVHELLQNPELEDTMSILEAVVRREAENIQSLGKRLQKMFDLFSRTGQMKPSSPAATPPLQPLSSVSTLTESSEDSPTPST